MRSVGDDIPRPEAPSRLYMETMNRDHVVMRHLQQEVVWSYKLQMFQLMITILLLGAVIWLATRPRIVRLEKAGGEGEEFGEPVVREMALPGSAPHAAPKPAVTRVGTKEDFGEPHVRRTRSSAAPPQAAPQAPPIPPAVVVLPASPPAPPVPRLDVIEEIATSSELINLELIKKFKEMLNLLELPQAVVDTYKKDLVRMMLSRLRQEMGQRLPTLGIEEEVGVAGLDAVPVPATPPPTPIPSRTPPAPPAATPPPVTVVGTAPAGKP